MNSIKIFHDPLQHMIAEVGYVYKKNLLIYKFATRRMRSETKYRKEEFTTRRETYHKI